MSKSLPTITHLQFLILEALSDAELAGRDLRDLLAGFGVRNSAPAFYQMMARLETADLVEGWYDQKLVGGQNVKERRYRLTPDGVRSLDATRNFYVARLAAGARGQRKRSHA
jgi:DNA-binding PadR family transcriptional regulator